MFKNNDNYKYYKLINLDRFYPNYLAPVYVI